MVVEKWGSLPRIAVLAAFIGAVTGVVGALATVIGALGQYSLTTGEALMLGLMNVPYDVLLGAATAVILSYPAYFILRRWGFSQPSRSRFFWFCAALGFVAFVIVFLGYVLGQAMSSPDQFLLLEQRILEAFILWWPYLGFALVPAALAGLASFIVATPADTAGLEAGAGSASA